jgi:surface protein
VETKVGYTNLNVPNNVSATYTSQPEWLSGAVKSNLSSNIPNTATSVVFTDVAAPSNAVITDVSYIKDGSVVLWLDGTICYVSTQQEGMKIRSEGGSAEYMFRDKTAITAIDLRNLDTSLETNMASMFVGCSSLVSIIGLNQLDTSNVAIMRYMFENCASLTEIDLSSFDTRKVSNMIQMFNGCINLKTILVGDMWYVNNVTYSSSMFSNCKKLTGQSGTTYNVYYIDKTRANYETGYLTRYNPVELIVDNQCSDLISVDAPATVHGGGTRIKLTSLVTGKTVESFTLNGVTITGNRFVAPENGGAVVIADVVLIDAQPLIFQSAHNPYANNVNQYYEAQFDGAKSLTVQLTYQTQSIYYDWVQLLNASGATISNKYGGTTKTTTTITVNGDYVKIWFKTDGSVNSYYGFHAVVTPVYD